MFRELGRPERWKLLRLALLLALLNIVTVQGWIQIDEEGCPSPTKRLRLLPSVPAFVTFDEGTSDTFTATFPELANWTILSTNSNLIWEPSAVPNSMAAIISVRLREGAPVLGGKIPKEICGGAKICAFAIGTIIDACGWNRACAKFPQIEGLSGSRVEYTFKENEKLDITFSLKDPGRVWTAEILSSHSLLKPEGFVWKDGTANLTVKANTADLIPCQKEVCLESGLPLTFRLTSGDRIMTRTILIAILVKKA